MKTSRKLFIALTALAVIGAAGSIVFEFVLQDELYKAPDTVRQFVVSTRGDDFYLSAAQYVLFHTFKWMFGLSLMAMAIFAILRGKDLQ